MYQDCMEFEIPSSRSCFDENINDYPGVHEYPVATATHKAVQVYESEWLTLFIMLQLIDS